MSISVITPKKHIKNSIKLYIMEIDNTAKHANSHLVIMGKPEVGETQFILKIFADIRIQSYHQTNSVYFDYKGDVVDNHAGLLILPGETGFWAFSRHTKPFWPATEPLKNPFKDFILAALSACRAPGQSRGKIDSNKDQGTD